MKQKLMKVMMACDEQKPLSGFIELDDAYLGGERTSTPGRGVADKTPFVAAVQTTKEGHPEAVKFAIEKV